MAVVHAALRELQEMLAPLERPTPPLDGPVPREHARDARWVEPRLAGKVHYAESGPATATCGTRRGVALRPDKTPADVVREAPPGQQAG